MRNTTDHSFPVDTRKGTTEKENKKADRFYRWLLVLVWVAFLLRGLFYCVQQPMWEGYDEWAHFAYIQQIAEKGTLPDRGDPVSNEMQRSLQLVPLSKAAAADVAGRITHESFWRLTRSERNERERILLELSPNAAAVEVSVIAPQYEAQQPPLYYLLLMPGYSAMRNLSLPARILGLRILSVLTASVVVFLGFSVARRVFGDPALSIVAVALMASLPGLLIDISRVGNESLAIVLTSAVLLCALRASDSAAGWRDWLWLGLAMAVALLTKSYTLAFIPLGACAALASVVRHPPAWKRAVAGCCLSWGLALAIAGWWYASNWVETGTLSGEQLDSIAAKLTSVDKAAAMFSMNWLRVADAAMFSHVWIGGWSFLVVRSWMYRVFEVIAGLAAAGCAVYLVRLSGGTPQARVKEILKGPVWLIAMVYALMCLAVAYHSLVAFIAAGQTTALGWYLYAAVVAEVVLLVLGIAVLMGKRCAAAGAAGVSVLVAALDLYAAHFLLMPYYTGMIGRRASGALESFHVDKLVGNFGEMLRRLSINEPTAVNEATIAVLWVSYVCATLGLAVLAVVVAGRKARASTVHE